MSTILVASTFILGFWLSFLATSAISKEYAEDNRAETTPFDIVWEGQTPGEDPGWAASIVRPFAEAGATWWIESPWMPPNAPEDLRRRIEQGPPSAD